MHHRVLARCLSVTVFSSRELAYQIADQFRVFGKPVGLKDAVIVGGIGAQVLYY